MKKLIVVMLALVLCLCVTGCKKDAPAADPGATNTQTETPADNQDQQEQNDPVKEDSKSTPQPE